MKKFIFLQSNGNLDSKEENNLRRKIIKEYRGYPNKKLFDNFPHIHKWEFVKFNRNDLEKLFYIDYDYWNELSKGTFKPKIAASTISDRVEIFGVSNEPFITGAKIIC